MEEDLFHEEHAVSFVVWMAKNHPNALYKYEEDDDGGRAAFEGLYQNFKSSLEEEIPD